MRTKRCWQLLALGIGLSVATASGCQTYNPESGLTLPSGHYLRHPPQYFPPSPPFPLPREQANLEEAMAQQAPAGPAALGGAVP